MASLFRFSSLQAWARLCFSPRRATAPIRRKTRSVAPRAEFLETRMLLTTPQVTAVFSGNNLSLSLPNTAGEAVTLTVNYCNSTECYISVVGATFNTTGASQFSGSGSTTLTYTAPIDGLTDNGLIGSLNIGGPSTSASTVTTDTIDTVNLNEVGLEEANSALSVNAAQINLNNSTTSIDVTNLTLTSVNSLNWATMGVDYQGTTTVNAPCCLYTFHFSGQKASHAIAKSIILRSPTQTGKGPNARSLARLL